MLAGGGGELAYLPSVNTSLGIYWSQMDIQYHQQLLLWSTQVIVWLHHTVVCGTHALLGIFT